jgi:hypothetical protein
MIKYPEDDDAEVACIAAAIVRAKAELRSGTPRDIVYRDLSDAIHMVWEIRKGGPHASHHPRSKALRQDESAEAVVDHPIPLSLLAEIFANLARPDIQRFGYLRRLLHEYAGFALITVAERDRLEIAGLAANMPADWDGLDRFARYRECGVTLGEPDLMRRADLEQVLSSPPLPYYVYTLRDRNKRLFYVGKGLGTRALMHERELFGRSRNVHVNWKKLNRMASIILSGARIMYEIDSWHADATSAFVREDKLILKYERADPRGFCNSNGQRSRGKPSKALLALRSDAVQMPGRQ